MATAKKVEALAMAPVTSSPQQKPFTGLARSVICYNTHKRFRNFKIVTLHIEKDRVVKCEYSDPYASFEAISLLELWNERSILHLNNTWRDEVALST